MKRHSVGKKEKKEKEDKEKGEREARKEIELDEMESSIWSCIFYYLFMCTHTHTHCHEHVMHSINRRTKTTKDLRIQDGK